MSWDVKFAPSNNFMTLDEMPPLEFPSDPLESLTNIAFPKLETLPSSFASSTDTPSRIFVKQEPISEDSKALQILGLVKNEPPIESKNVPLVPYRPNLKRKRPTSVRLDKYNDDPIIKELYSQLKLANGQIPDRVERRKKNNLLTQRICRRRRHLEFIDLKANESELSQQLTSRTKEKNDLEVKFNSLKSNISQFDQGVYRLEADIVQQEKSRFDHPFSPHLNTLTPPIRRKSTKKPSKVIEKKSEVKESEVKDPTEEKKLRRRKQNLKAAKASRERKIQKLYCLKQNLSLAEYNLKTVKYEITKLQIRIHIAESHLLHYQKTKQETV